MKRSSTVFTTLTAEDIEAAASSDITIQMADNAGANSVIFQDSDGTTVMTVNSDGDLTISS